MRDFSRYNENEKPPITRPSLDYDFSSLEDEEETPIRLSSEVATAMPRATTTPRTQKPAQAIKPNGKGFAAGLGGLFDKALNPGEGISADQITPMHRFIFAFGGLGFGALSYMVTNVFANEGLHIPSKYWWSGYAIAAGFSLAEICYRLIGKDFPAARIGIRILLVLDILVNIFGLMIVTGRTSLAALDIWTAIIVAFGVFLAVGPEPMIVTAGKRNKKGGNYYK